MAQLNLFRIRYTVFGGSLDFNFYPFHSILVVGKVIEAQRNTSSSHGGPGYFQQLLNSSMSHKLSSKFLV